MQDLQPERDLGEAAAQRVVISRLYRVWLGRGPTPEEVGYWRPRLAADAGLADLRRSLIGEDPARTRIIAETSRLYRSWLGRVATLNEQAAWYDRIHGGDEFADMRRALITDPTGAARLTTEAVNLYRAFLGREPEPNELGGWLDLIKEGAEVADLRRALVHDPAAVAVIRARIAQAHHDQFGRPPEAADADYWLGAIQNGRGFDDLAAALADADGAASPSTFTLYPPDVFRREAVLASTLREGPPGASAAWESGRNIQAGYVRGLGLQSGELVPMIEADPDWNFAVEASQGRSLVQEHSLMNLFLILKYAPLTGNVIEFGSYAGGSALFMAALAQRLRPGCRVYALDTYEGMPEVEAGIDHHHAGQFGDAHVGEIEAVRRRYGLDNLVLVKGLFDEAFFDIPQSERRFFLSHVDCDIHASMLSAIRLSREHLADAGYMVFDDPLYSTCLGAMKAVETELIQRAGLHAEQVYPHLVYRHRRPAATIA